MGFDHSFDGCVGCRSGGEIETLIRWRVEETQDESRLLADQIVRRGRTVWSVDDAMQGQRATGHHDFRENGAREIGIGFNMDGNARPRFHQPQYLLRYFAETHLNDTFVLVMGFLGKRRVGNRINTTWRECTRSLTALPAATASGI